MNSDNSSFEIEPRKGDWQMCDRAGHGQLHKMNKLVFRILERGQANPGHKIKSWWASALETQTFNTILDEPLLVEDEQLDAVKRVPLEDDVACQSKRTPDNPHENPGESSSTLVSARSLGADVPKKSTQRSGVKVEKGYGVTVVEWTIAAKDLKPKKTDLDCQVNPITVSVSNGKEHCFHLKLSGKGVGWGKGARTFGKNHNEVSVSLCRNSECDDADMNARINMTVEGGPEEKPRVVNVVHNFGQCSIWLSAREKAYWQLGTDGYALLRVRIELLT